MSRNPRPRTLSLLLLLTVAATALTACGGDAAGGGDGSLRKVTFNLAYLPQGSEGGIFAAIGKGYYREAGLDVTAVRGYGGTRTVNEIAQGKWDFGYGDPISVILNRAQGGATRMVGAINKAWPGGVCYDADKFQIDGIDDLEGLSLGAGATSPSQQLIPAWLELNGYPRDWVNLLKMDFAVIDTSLISGEIDLDDCWQASNRANVKLLAEDAGMNLAWLDFHDHKLDIYANGVVTSDALIERDPELVRKFLAATYRGYEFMFDNPDETVDIIMGMHPQLNRDVLALQVESMRDLMVDRDTATKGLGWISDARMRSTLDFVTDAFDVEGEVKVEDIYTTEFLGGE